MTSSPKILNYFYLFPSVITVLLNLIPVIITNNILRPRHLNLTMTILFIIPYIENFTSLLVCSSEQVHQIISPDRDDSEEEFVTCENVWQPNIETLKVRTE